MKFKQKVVIVTGGGQGIGKAVARAFAAQGAKVVIADIDVTAGRENETFIHNQGQDAIFIEVDVSREEDVKRMVAAVVDQYKTIDILVNNAGIAAPRSAGNPIEWWDRVIAVNLKGTYMCSAFCAEVMAQSSNGGSIVNIASTRAFMSEPHTEAYSASKGGIIALTHSLAVTFGPDKIRINTISPGWIEVSEWKKTSAAKPAVLREIDHLQHPAGRVGKPEDIAAGCLFLCSEDAGFITGTNLMIDGGMTIKMIYEE